LLIIYPFDEAIDPSKTQSLFNRVVIWNARPFAGLLIIDEPDFGLCLVVLFQPGSPLLAIGSIERFGYLHVLILCNSPVYAQSFESAFRLLLGSSRKLKLGL